MDRGSPQSPIIELWYYKQDLSNYLTLFHLIFFNANLKMFHNAPICCLPWRLVCTSAQGWLWVHISISCNISVSNQVINNPEKNHGAEIWLFLSGYIMYKIIIIGLIFDRIHQNWIKQCLCLILTWLVVSTDVPATLPINYCICIMVWHKGKKMKLFHFPIKLAHFTQHSGFLSLPPIFSFDLGCYTSHVILAVWIVG